MPQSYEKKLEHQRAYYYRNRAARRAYQRKYYREHVQKRREYQRGYWHDNRELYPGHHGSRADEFKVKGQPGMRVCAREGCENTFKERQCNHGGKKYCSTGCRLMAQREYLKKYYADHKEAYSRRGRKWREEQKQEEAAKRMPVWNPGDDTIPIASRRMMELTAEQMVKNWNRIQPAKWTREEVA